MLRSMKRGFLIQYLAEVSVRIDRVKGGIRVSARKYRAKLGFIVVDGEN